MSTLHIYNILHTYIQHLTSIIHLHHYIHILYIHVNITYIHIQSKKGPTSCCSRDDCPLLSFAEIKTVPHDNRLLIHAAPQLANLTCTAPTNLRASAPIK